MELQKQSKRQLTLDSIIKVYIIKQSSFLHQKQFSIDSHFYIFLGVLGMIVLLQYLNYQQMKNSEFELIDFNKNTKDIQFSQVPDDIKKTVIRLLRPQTYSPQQVEQRKNIFCNLYIDPLSTFTLVWNLFYLFVFYIVELQITLSLAFGPHFFEDQLQAKSFYRPIYIIVVLYFSVDLFLNFFKGYYAFGQGKVIDDWNLIKSKYLKSQFPIDIIVLIIYTIPLIYNDYHVNFLQLVPGILLWLKKFKYQSQIIDYLQYQVTIRLIFMLVILFSDVLMIGNYGACIFIGLDILLYNHQFYGSNDAYYWLTNNTSYPFSLISGPWYYEYIYGQEFSTGTLSTLAPGPFAKNPIQAIYAVVVMILFMVIASYVGEVLIQITQTYSQQRVFHQDNIISFDNFMQLKDVQKNIRDRIHNFFELIWEVELKVQSKQQQEMVDQLPKYLKQQLLLEMGFAKSIYFLRYFANQSSLQKIISSKFQRMTVDSDTCIFQTQSIKTFNRNIYFIKQGMAKFYVNQEKLMLNYSDFNPEGKIVSQKILNLSNVERILGVYEFITGQNYSICCKSIDLCLLQKLSYQSFMEIIEQSGLWEEYKELQQKVLIGRQLRLINKCCVLCLQSHMESQCPQLCLTQRVKQQTNYKKLMGKQQKRKSFHRRPHVSKKILGNQSFKKKEALSIFNLFQDLNLGKVILQINKLSQFPIQQLEQVHSYSNYFNEHNIQ